MATFVKAQASSLISTIIDFTTTIVCNHFFHLWYVYSNFTGTVAGGVTNFALGRFWVFDAQEKNAPKQMVKYILVWMGNLGLNNGGVYLFVDFFHIDKYISKIIVSLVVGIGYNYVMQKKFVFA
ncbi:GtrA family protein [Mucilaginibacter limnophilus]|uniref:GtrA family protein n=1 Tax=Mucilaginibacter limnophilus TaxID=1932778 RepID=A0A437MTU6_9SPHI|nr:GtrA family protein [Mucilaginibacter limnophilus]RVU01063.1 GtrA family protein [Mucilaginibacter limnophilus]